MKNTNVLTISKNRKIESIVCNIFCILSLFAFGYISIISLFQTSVIDPQNYSGEVILFNWDLIPINFLVLIVFGFAMYKLCSVFNVFAKIKMKYMYIALSVYVLVVGFLWVTSVTSIPAADSQSVFDAASKAAVNDYSSLVNGSNFHNHEFYKDVCYFNYYPFQLGFVLISEIVLRIFGVSSSMPLQYINVICVALSYVAVAKISKLVFKKRSIEFFTIVFLFLCLQPVLFCTFVYGNIIGMCCAIWASYFMIKYFQGNNYLFLIPASALLIVATLAKYNNLIYLVAFVIMLLIHMIRSKKWVNVLIAIGLCIVTIGSSNLVIMSYEARANTKFYDGISQTMYLNMGLGESQMAPGWFNFSTMTIYQNNNFDTNLSNQVAQAELSQKLGKFTSDPGYAVDFFSKKVSSQWNETTYESIWVSKVKAHTNEVNGAVESVYNKSLGQFLGIYFDQYMQILFLLFALGLGLLLFKNKANVETMLLPLVLLGAFGYHMLFEGKSQYVLTYIILLIPTASYGLNTIFCDNYSKIKNIFSKLENLNKKQKES